MASGEIIHWNSADTSSYSIVFNGNITAKVFFSYGYWGKCSSDLNGLPENYTVNIDMNGATWFDALGLMYLILELTKIAENHEITFSYLECAGNTEKARFHLFLKESGFINCISNIVRKEYSEIVDTSSLERYRKKISESTYGLCPTIIPITVIRTIGEWEDFKTQLVTVIRRYGTSYQESGNLLSKIIPIIQETVDNVFEHAYDTDEKYCCLYLRSLKYGKVIEENVRQYERANSHKDKYSAIFSLNDSRKRDGATLKSYLRDVFVSEDTYMNTEQLVDYRDSIQIFVVDIGKGIAKSFGNNLPGDDRNAVEKIFTEGKRSKKKLRNTKVGGLSMIKHLLEENGGFIGVKGDYSWIGVQCGNGKVGYSYITKDARGEKYPSKGAAFIFEIRENIGEPKTIFGRIDVSDNWRGLFLCPNDTFYRNLLASSYSGEEICYQDLRYLHNINEVEETSQSEIVILTYAERNKNEIVNQLFNIKKDIKSLIIGEIPDAEWKKYFFIVSNIKNRSIANIILVTKRLTAGVFTTNQKTGKFYFNYELTEKYCKHFSRNAPISISLISYLVWLRHIDSKLIWNYVLEKNLYVDEKIAWDKDYSIDGYLDFSGLLMNEQSKEILFDQLSRLQSYYGHIEYVAIDRLTEDLCDEVNSRNDESVNSVVKIGIGSVYVTGNTQEKRMVDYSFFFFNHGNEDNCAIYEWTQQYANNGNNRVTWFRVGRSPFISRFGDDYFRKIHYRNSNIKYELTQDVFYRKFGELSEEINTGIRIGHFDMVDRHDSFFMDIVGLFLYDKNWHFSVNYTKNDSNLWDYLLSEFSLSIADKAEGIFDLQTDYLEKMFATKVESYRKDKEEVFKNGLIIYSTDYQTREIVEVLRPVFTDEYRRKVIPISPIVKNRSSSSLLTSPIFLDGLRTTIEQYKCESHKIVITLFFAEAISTRKKAEIEHVLYCLGASEVRTLAIADRMRFSLGADSVNQMKAFCKLDLPSARNNNSCLLCKGINEFLNLENELILKGLKDASRRLRFSFQTMRSFDNMRYYGITPRRIQLSKALLESLGKICNAYGFTQKVNIVNDVQLTLFSVEATVISLSSQFLLDCLEDNLLSNDTKILLICSHLFHFNSQEISKMVYDKCISSLWEICRKKGNNAGFGDKYLQLGIVTLAGLIDNDILSEMLLKVYKDKFYVDECNIYIYLLYVLLYVRKGNKYTIWELEGRTNRSAENILEKMYGIILHTEKGYDHTHSNISYRIYTKSATPYQKVDKLLLEVQYLLKKYEAIDERYRGDNHEYEVVLKALGQEAELIEKMQKRMISPDIFNSQIQEYTQIVIDTATIINERDFIRQSKNWRVLDENLKLIAEQVISDGYEGNCGKLDKIGINVKPSSDYRLFYYNHDVETEIGYLMSDFRHASDYSIIDHDDDFKRSYCGLVEVEFGQVDVVISFKNHISSDISVKEIQRIKSKKIIRPSHLIFEIFKSQLPALESNPRYYEDCINKERVFVAEVHLPYVEL